jgi:lipopolysaccharide export system protein LptA
MKRFSLLLAVLFGVLVLGEAAAQSSAVRSTPSVTRTAAPGEKKAPVRLRDLFESRQTVTPEVKAKAAAAVASASANPETVNAVESAARAVADASGSPAALKEAMSKVDTASVLSEGAKLIESSLPSMKASDVDLDLQKLMPAVAAVTPALTQAVASAGKSVSEQPKEKAEKPAAKPGVAKADPPVSARSAGMRMLPDGTQVPMPVDPLPNRIPRPEAVGAVKPTRITAGFAAFDANTNKVTFEENVELDHVEFKLTCDVLVAELNSTEKDEKGGKSATPPGEAKAQAEGPQAAAARVSAGGLRRAKATGYVVIEKLTPEGSQVAKSRMTEYDAETGIVTLSEYPVLDDGKNLVKGKEAWTKILMSPDGKYEVKGPATFELVTSANQLKPGRPH